MALISIIIAGATLLLNIVVFLLFNKKLAEQNKIINSYKIKEIEDTEKQKLTAIVSTETYWQDYESVLFLVVHNYGPATARNIEVIDLCEDDYMFKNTESFFPIQQLGANESIEIPLFVYSEMHNNIRVSISWEDELKEIKTQSQILNIR